MEYLLDFVHQSFVLSQQVVDRYSHKYSKQTFTQPQLIVLNLIRIKCDWTYRETKEALLLMPGVREALNLDSVPHHTTIQKAFDRLDATIWRLLLTKTVNGFDQSGHAGIDSTGFERSRASRYYTQRTKMKLNAVKTTILVDVSSQVILDCHLTTTRKHDTQIGPTLLKKHSDLQSLVADKGYDTKELRHPLRSQNIRPLIRHREFRSVDKAANARMNDDDYNQRQKVETVFSVLKRKYGDRIRSRKWYRQFREMIARMVVYNLDKFVKELCFFESFSSSNFVIMTLVFKDFYKAENLKQRITPISYSCVETVANRWAYAYAI